MSNRRIERAWERAQYANRKAKAARGAFRHLAYRRKARWIAYAIARSAGAVRIDDLGLFSEGVVGVVLPGHDGLHCRLADLPEDARLLLLALLRDSAATSGIDAQRPGEGSAAPAGYGDGVRTRHALDEEEAAC
jgi:hypothetical protein